MNVLGTIPDIPKIYTAIAEWLSCLMYVVLYGSPATNKKKTATLVLSLLCLIVVQELIGILPDALWIPGMVVALFIMYVQLLINGDFARITAGYCLVRAFIFAEFVAALEWQVASYVTYSKAMNRWWVHLPILIIVYAGAYLAMYHIENRHMAKNKGIRHFDVQPKELWNTVLIGVVFFLLSNLSYVYTNTPFSSNIADVAYNIRTLIDLAGVAILYAYHVQQHDLHVQMENASIKNILTMQYAQYKQSRENIDLINRKYHDLKHQIQVLRNESDLDRRTRYLDEMEEEIKAYEAQNKTGNSVLDTVLTSKSLYCSKHGIEFTCVADGTLLQHIYVMDICNIFGNALDNAIEYELQIPEKEKRLIHLSVSSWNDFILIQVENYFEGELKLKNGLPVTTKADSKNHGFGVKSIKYAAEKYGGSINISQKKNWFVLKVLLPKQAE